MTSIRHAKAEAPCKAACPAGVDVPRYVRLIGNGHFDEALATIREKLPLPLICGFICTHPCEAMCRSGQLGAPIAIRALKRFAVELAKSYQDEKMAPSTGKTIAIIGSGLAGLTAAYYLAKCGHTVTIFEKKSRPGGMLWTAIPRFILPEEILQREINDLLSVGIELRLNITINNVRDLMEEGYNAIFISIGAEEAKKLPIPGNDFKGVLVGLHFLHDVNLGKKVTLGEKVLVLGGGGVACDVARTALRLGSKEVHIVCLESRRGMPARAWDLKDAEQEGVHVHPLRTFRRIIGKDGYVRGVECLKLRWAKLDREGSPHWEPIEGSEHVLEADTVIFATGHTVNPSIVSDVSTIEINKKGNIIVDHTTLQTGQPDIFAGGDALTGPTSAIEAIASGRLGAMSIDKHLGGHGILQEATTPPEREVPLRVGGIPANERVKVPSLPLSGRLSGFTAVELGFTKEQAIQEAKRCLWCDLPIIIDETKCVGCSTCAFWCSFSSNKTFNPANGKIKIVSPERGSTFAQPEIVFAEDCDTCGICVNYCAYGALAKGKLDS